MVGRLGLTLLCAGVLAGTALAAGSGPREPQKRHNAADQAWARAIRIHRADLGSGDWRVEQSNDDNGGAPKGCKDPDLSDLVETGEAENPDFSRNGSFVGSGAAVFLNEEQATSAWQRVARQPVNRCMIEAFRKAIAGSGARLSAVSDRLVQTPKLAPHFTAGRVRIAVSGPAAKIRGRISYYFYARGRATALLMVVSFGPPMQPIPESLERRLAGLVAERLRR